jgi:predicted MFS family arabinose efflux permease
LPAPATTANGRSPGRAITLLALVSFGAQAMVRVTDSLLPQIAADLQVTVGAASIAITVYMLAHGSVQWFIGPIADRVGKYICIAIAASCSAAFTAACGFASSLEMLMAARLACGLATGWIIPLALAFVGDVIPYETRQRVIGRFLSGQILGQLFGQAAGGILGDYFGWRNVFFILAAILATAAVLLFIEFTRNPITHASGNPSPPGRGFVADYKTVLGSSWARTMLLLAFLESALMFGAFTYVGADLHLRFGLNFTLVGLFVGFFAIGGLVYSLSVGHLINRLGPTGLAAGGGALLGIAYLVIAFEPYPWIAPAAIVLIGLGFYMLHNTLQTNATQMTPEARGTGVALFSSALYLGQMTGVAAAGFAFDHFTAVPIFVFAAVTLFALGLWFASHLVRRAAANDVTKGAV